MTALLCALALALIAPQPADVRSGKIVLYGPDHGDMTGIAARQGVTVQPWENCIAGWYESDLGRRGTLTIGARVWPVVVCDYAHPGDLEEILARGIAGETAYPLAVEAGFVGDGWAEGTVRLEAVR